LSKKVSRYTVLSVDRMKTRQWCCRVFLSS